VAAEHGFPIWLTMADVLGGRLMVRQDASVNHIERIRNGIAAWKSTGARLLLPFFQTLLAEALLMVGQASEAFAVCEDGIELAQRTEERFYLPNQSRILREITRLR
jgi:predicted ATPase